MFHHTLEMIDAVELEINDKTTVDQALESLRGIGLDDFGYLLMTMPNPRYPRLSGLLPNMAAEQIQRDWTGNAAEPLLLQSSAFVRSVAYNYTQITGRTLQGADILDFGCGYGRLARLMYYFTGTKGLIGIDPWTESIRICREAGLGEGFMLSDYLPHSLPVGDRKFDLIFAFSVFTHLSKRTTLLTLETLGKYLRKDGVLVITIRPVEYWHHDGGARLKGCIEQQIKLHHDEGFAFLPHNRDAIDGDITYGDTSLSLDWLRQQNPQFEIRAIDRSLSDPLQIQVYLGHRRGG